jgi:cadmium resistance protein CadD (predicted permease)
LTYVRRQIIRAIFSAVFDALCFRKEDGVISVQMDSFLALTGLAAVVFASTNIDDFFVLVGFFADKNFRARHVVIGQYVGICALYVISAVAGLISLVIPTGYVGLLGLAPIAIGIKKLYYLWRNRETEESVSGFGGHGSNLAVAAVTVANGGDNIAVYTALFATCQRVEVPVIGIVFAVMTALWCLGAHWLVNHRALGMPIRAQAHRIVPFVLIGLGILIFIRTGAIQLLNH